MGRKITGKWLGGPKGVDRLGRDVFIIEKTLNGNRYLIRLDTDDEELAKGIFARFLTDPEAVKAEMSKRSAMAANATVAKPSNESLVITEELIGNFKKYHLAPAPLGRGASQAHANTTEAHLLDWGNALKGRDLRELKVADIRQLLILWPGSPYNSNYRAASLKTFCTWLVNVEERMTEDENASARFKVKQPKAAKFHGKQGYTIAQVEELYRHISTQVIRDVVVMKVFTSMHLTEIDRFAAKERSGMKRIDHEQIAGYIWYPHKKQEEHSQYVSPQVWSAAERLVKRGSAPIKGVIQDHFERVAKRIKEKTEREDVETIMFGQIRHCFATWTHSVGRTVKPEVGGVPLHEVADIMGHTNLRTTGKYNQADIKPMVVLPINLHHPEDPPALDISKRPDAARSVAG